MFTESDIILKGALDRNFSVRNGTVEGSPQAVASELMMFGFPSEDARGWIRRCSLSYRLAILPSPKIEIFQCASQNFTSGRGDVYYFY